jgi:hypothetical protein
MSDPARSDVPKKSTHCVLVSLRAADFNVLFAGIPISTVAAGEFSNFPPAFGTGASAYVGVLAPIPVALSGGACSY